MKIENKHGQFPDILLNGNFLPPDLTFEVSNICNVSCIMCDVAQRILKNGKPERRELTKQQMFERFETIKFIKTATLSGGHSEPFLNKDIIDIIRFLKTKGAWVSVISNGTALSPKLIDELIKVGLDSLKISLHGTSKKVAENIMVKSDFDKVVKNICGLVNAKKRFSRRKPDLDIAFIGMKRNIQEFPDVVRKACQWGVDSVTLNSLMERQAEGLHEIKGESLVYYPELLKEKYKKALDISREGGIILKIVGAYSAIIANKNMNPEEGLEHFE